MMVAPPAVVDPPFLNTGFNLARVSIVVPALTPSSLLIWKTDEKSKNKYYKCHT